MYWKCFGGIDDMLYIFKMYVLAFGNGLILYDVVTLLFMYLNPYKVLAYLNVYRLLLFLSYQMSDVNFWTCGSVVRAMFL